MDITVSQSEPGVRLRSSTAKAMRDLLAATALCHLDGGGARD